MTPLAVYATLCVHIHIKPIFILKQLSAKLQDLKIENTYVKHPHQITVE